MRAGLAASVKVGQGEIMSARHAVVTADAAVIRDIAIGAVLGTPSVRLEGQ